MTISRGQMNRQLYMGGGIMNAMPRQQYGLGSFVKKAVKKVTGAVKDVASSDIGKAALLAGAGMYAGGLGPFASGKFGAGFASNLLPSSIGSTVTNMFSKKGIQGALVKGGALAGLTSFLTSQYGVPEEEVESVLSDPAEKEKYLRLYYTNLNPVTADTNAEQYQQEVDEFVRTNSAMGGRIGYALGGNELPPDPTTPVNPFKPKPIGPVLPNKAENVLSFEEFVESRQKFMKQESIEKLMQEYDRYLKDLKMNQLRDMVAGGGIMNRAGYALGDTASQNAMQAAGIEGLPIRQNPKGVQELDLRDNGGFIPPVGIKEKEDDIPAMLSNNEFVFTADAVRGMGDGDVELGAQRMYDQMKMLEEGGRV
jgi:hypothetical protein